jgi:hypothetical protein
MRLFENHPDLNITDYTFLNAYYWGPECLSPEHSLQTLTQSGSIIPDATYQNGFNQLQKSIADAEAAGKIPFIKEHLVFIIDPQITAANVKCLPNGTPYVPNARPTIESSSCAPEKSISLPANPTILSNDFLTTFLPVILIRHPAKVFPSFYRASRDVFRTTVFDAGFSAHASLRWPRLIFEWYEEYYRISKTEQRPVVIDADDMINDSRNIAEKFCTITGLDPKHVQYSWAEATGECKANVARFKSTLRSSTGIIREDQASIS